MSNSLPHPTFLPVIGMGGGKGRDEDLRLFLQWILMLIGFANSTVTLQIFQVLDWFHPWIIGLNNYTSLSLSLVLLTVYTQGSPSYWERTKGHRSGCFPCFFFSLGFLRRGGNSSRRHFGFSDYRRRKLEKAHHPMTQTSLWFVYQAVGHYFKKIKVSGSSCEW